MYVVATAGHVDHGKSTLLRALTGMQTDRLAEERRRGLSIELGYAWTTLPTGQTIAFVDVPGHERFLGTMLAGVGPVPAALLVVAADGGVMPQTIEHLAVLTELGVEHAVVAITRTDLADPRPAADEVRRALDGGPLARAEIVPVSAATGHGRGDLLAALGRLVYALPAADTGGDVRLWVDRAFTVRGVGTVATATLGAGTVRRGDRLRLGPSGHAVTVRGLESLGKPVESVTAIARVALNLRGADPGVLRRGSALVTPGRFSAAWLVDVRVASGSVEAWPRDCVLHVGAAAVAAQLRPLGGSAGRLRLAESLPLRVGDRVLLRDPGSRALAGGTVLDPDPPALRRRGAARARGAELAARPPAAGGDAELARRGVVRGRTLATLGFTCPSSPPLAGDWYVDPPHAAHLRAQLARILDDNAAADPLSAGVPLETARQALGLPDVALVPVLAPTSVMTAAGRLRARTEQLPAAAAVAVGALRDRLRTAPFAAPSVEELAAAGLGRAELVAACRIGLLLEVAPRVYLAPDAPSLAATRLAALSQPFTVSSARTMLQSSRRVVVPLLELLDARHLTRRWPDDSRSCA